MKVGDLVRYKSSTGIGQYGVIVRLKSHIGSGVVVEWMNSVRCSYPERYLEVVCK